MRQPSLVCSHAVCKSGLHARLGSSSTQIHVLCLPRLAQVDYEVLQLSTQRLLTDRMALTYLLTSKNLSSKLLRYALELPLSM